MTQPPSPPEDAAKPLASRVLVPLENLIDEFGLACLCALLQSNRLYPFSDHAGRFRLDRSEILAAIVFPTSAESVLRALKKLPAVTGREPMMTIRAMFPLLHSRFPGISIHKLYELSKIKKIPVIHKPCGDRIYYMGRISEVIAALEKCDLVIVSDATLYNDTMVSFGFHPSPDQGRRRRIH